MAKKQNTTTVTSGKQFAETAARLHQSGYIPMMPKARNADTGGHVASLHDVIGAQLRGGEKTDGRSQRNAVPLLYASSGNEEMKGIPESLGTKGLGYIEWGNGNKWPNVCALLTSMLPYTAAGWKFNTDLCAGMGPEPMYHYTQYVGGNITEKEIPFASAGILLKGQILDLQKQLLTLTNPQEPSNASVSGNTLPDISSIREEILSQINTKNEDYDKWDATMRELTAFLTNNNLQHVTLSLAGDQQMFGMSFPELLLNQKDLDANNRPVKTADWKPKVTGIRYRPAHTCRLERMDKNNRINFVYCSNRWYDAPYVEQSGAVAEIAAYPCLSPEHPYLDLSMAIIDARAKNVTEAKRPTRFIMPTSYPTPGRPYYPQVPWHSIFGGSIYEMAATIVDDRATRRKNSNVIGRVIYIHNEYLQALWTQQNGDDKRTIDDLRDELYDQLNQWLSNRDNSGQAMLAFTFMGSDNKEHKSFEIVEIESNNANSASANETELQEISSIIFFAMGLDAKLIGNTPGDTRSAGGTDLRERYLLKQIQMSPTVNIILKPLDVITKFNEWDEHLVWRIKREVLTTLDNSKTGITTSDTE